MDITSFVIHGRDQALLYGDYKTYCAQLAKRMRKSRQKLGIATKKRAKFRKHNMPTSEDVGKDRQHVYLLLLASERAWAHALSMKSAHAADQKGVTGRTRSHIVSRLSKATRYAQHLVDILANTEVSSATAYNVLEATAYAALIQGAMQFEKRCWKLSLQSYATSRVVYDTLAATGRTDLWKDIISETVDPSLRYAAYQTQTPRTTPISTIVQMSFPTNDVVLVQRLKGVDAGFSIEPGNLPKIDSEAEAAPKTLVWRSREVTLEDAQISLAWASVSRAKAKLHGTFSELEGEKPTRQAAAYDGVLAATQDAVDATKQAIEELKAEGVTPSDPRMQRLQITCTAVNYEMISWRIGRNRIMTGRQDGALEEFRTLRRAKAPQEGSGKRLKELSARRKLAKLKEKVTLYDGTLQSIASIQELPGIAADEALAASLVAYEDYFKSLRFLSIARSHAVAGNLANALALINIANERYLAAQPKLAASTATLTEPALNIEVSAESANALGQLLKGELLRHRALVHIDNLRKASQNGSAASATSFLIDRLNEYPVRGVDLHSLVEFPPKMHPIPMKPLFLDVAWNYIDYPGRLAQASASGSAVASAQEPAPQPKRGWFGFGRS